MYCGAKASENDWRILSIMRLSYDSKVAANICQPLIVVIPAVEGNTNFDLILSCSIFFLPFSFSFTLLPRLILHMYDVYKFTVLLLSQHTTHSYMFYRHSRIGNFIVFFSANECQIIIIIE